MDKREVDILLLGSGWISQFVIPLLIEEKISCVYTRRSIPSVERVDNFVKFSFEPQEQDVRQQMCNLPAASLVVIVFPLRSIKDLQLLVDSYEVCTGCSPAWLALGSTGLWGKGHCNASSPIIPSNERGVAESRLLEMNQENRPTAVLNLAGLYGNQRNPVNFVKKVAETKEKLANKTSVHFVHGKDVSRAIVGMYRSLSDPEKKRTLWGRRWIVTDTYVYDWWHLLTTFKPPVEDHVILWSNELRQEHQIDVLPRPLSSNSDSDSTKIQNRAPYVLDRILDGQEFWDALKTRPSIGRCDDYNADGGGISPNFLHH